MNKNLQREAFEAFVRSGASPVPSNEVERPLFDGTYRTSAANAGWAFWRAAQEQVGTPNDTDLAALQKAAFIAIKLTTPPRDLLGPATAEMKGRAVLGERIATSILAINSPQYEEGRAAYHSGNKSVQSPYERGSDDSRTWYMGFDFERAANMAG